MRSLRAHPSNLVDLVIPTAIVAGAALGVAAIEWGHGSLLTAIATVVVGLCLRFPRAAVVLAYVAILLDSQGMTAVRIAGLPITGAKVTVILALGAHLLHRMSREQPLLEPTPISRANAAVLGSMILSLASVLDMRLAWIDLAGVGMLSVLLHLVYTSVKGSDVAALVRWMALATILVFTVVLLSGDASGAVASAHEAWSTRSSGAFTDPNAWATCVLVTSAFIIGSLAHDPHRHATPLLVGMLVVSPVALVQSMSRAGLLGFLVASPFVLWAAWPRRRLLGVAALSLMIVAPWVVHMDAVLLRYATLWDPSVEAGVGGHSLRERQALLETAMAIISSRPIFGVGVGNFRVVAEELTSGLVFKIAHNSYLTIAAEQGLPGVVSHLWLAVAVLRAALLGAARSEGAMRGVGRGFLAAVVGFAAMAATLNLSTFAVGWYVFAVGLLSAEPVPTTTAR